MRAIPSSSKRNNSFELFRAAEVGFTEICVAMWRAADRSHMDEESAKKQPNWDHVIPRHDTGNASS